MALFNTASVQNQSVLQALNNPANQSALVNAGSIPLTNASSPIYNGPAPGSNTVTPINTQLPQQQVPMQIPDYSAAISGLGQQVGSGFTGLGQQFTSGLTGLGQQVGTGFTGLADVVGQGFTGVGSQVQGLGEDVSEGFAQTQQGIMGLGQGMDTGFGQTQEALQSQAQAIADARAAQEAGFQSAQEQAAEMQTNVLGGQANIRQMVEQYGGDLGRFYQDLARGQTEQQQRLGTLQTGFTGFQGDYNRDVQQAAQQRARLAETVTGGFTGIRQDLGTQASAAEAASAQLAARMAGLGAQQAAGPATMGAASIARDLATGAAPQTQQAVQAQTEFVGRINAARMLVADPNAPLDVATRNQLADFSQSFDSTGRLIPRSIDAQGFQVSRAIDNSGRLLMAKFDQNGAQAQQQALDINRTLAAVDAIMSGGGGGLASPYMTPMA